MEQPSQLAIIAAIVSSQLCPSGPV